MKKKRITALLLALFMVTNETAYPFGAENTVVEENTEEISRQEDAGDDLVIEEGNESEDTQDEASTAEETEEAQDEASTAEATEEAQDENETDSVEVFSDDMEDADDSEEQGQTEVFSDSANVEEDSDFVINADGILTEYKGSDSDVVIPDEVTEIGDNVFKDNKTIESVEFPDNLRKIGSNAFYGCSSLRGELRLPDSLETIGEFAFYNCSGITGELTIPDKVSMLSYGVFAGVTGVAALTIGSGMNYIRTDSDSWHAFYQMNGVKTVTFRGVTPPSRNSISIFYSMLNLETVYVPEGTYKAYVEVYKDNMPEWVRLKEIGSGDFLISDGELISYSGNDKEVTVPEGVTGIGGNAFLNAKVEKVTLTPQVTEIGAYAFEKCKSLKAVDVKGVNNLVTVGNYAFSECTNLTGFSFGENLTEIGESAFYYCSGLSGNLTLPEGLKRIGNSAFIGCENLTGELKLPESLAEIGAGAFYGCSGFTGDLTIPSGITEIPDNAFYSCYGFDGKLNIPQSVTSIGNYAFISCYSLTGELTLPENLESIGREAFRGCRGFTGKLVVPDKITNLTAGAFSGLTGVTEITIGTGVNYIYAASDERHALYMPGVKTVTFLSETPPAASDSWYGVFRGMPDLKTIYVPKGTYTAYRAAYLENLSETVRMKETDGDDFVIADGELIGYMGDSTEVTIPESVTKIGNLAFAKAQIQKVIIPPEVTEIGEKAFQNSSLEVVEFSGDNNVAVIGKEAFSGCRKLTGFSFSEKLTEIKARTFEYCEKMSGELNLPSGLTEIGDSAFSSCTELNGKLTLPEGITRIGIGAFQWCGKLTGELNLPSSLTDIGESAFYGCSGFSGDLTIPSGITEIKQGTFASCSGFAGKLNIPDSVTNIGNSAFCYCSSLIGELNLPENLESIGCEAFRGCTGLTGELVIPDKITGIPYGTFGGMTGIEAVTINKNVTSIYTASNEASAFYNMPGVKTVTFLGEVPPSASDRWYSIFYGMSNLKTVYVPKGTYKAYSDAYREGLAETVRLKETGGDDFVITDGELTGYMGNSTEVTVSESVTKIGASAFAKAQIQKIIIPPAVTEIGEKAFQNSSLEVVEFSGDNNVAVIGKEAFSGCRKLTGFSFSEKLTEIKARTFEYCEKMSGELNLPSGLTEIGDSAFSSCTGLNGKLILPEGITRIGSGAFQWCENFTGELKLPSGLIEMGDSAFYGCSRFTGDLTIPSGITEIKPGTFASCKGFDGKLNIPDSVTNIGNYAFCYCSSLNGELKLPKNLEFIGSEVFKGCTGFTGELMIPDKVKDILYGTFSGMTGITAITIGNSVKFINVASEDAHAFYNMPEVKTVTFLGETPPSVNDSWYSIFRNMPNLEIIYVPQGTYKAYNEAYGAKIPENVLLKENGSGDLLITEGELLSYTGEETEFTIPSGVTKIGARAFRTSQIQRVIFSSEVTEIADYAFQNCISLEEVIFSGENNVEIIGSGAFEGCSKLNGFAFGEKLRVIQNMAFGNCESLTGELKFSDSLISVGEGCFYNCFSLNGTLKLPDSITSIGTQAFSGCTGITGELVIPAGITEITRGAFSGMSGVTSLTFGENISSVYTYYNDSDHAFYNMAGVKSVRFLGKTPPSGNGYSIFVSMPNLQKKYVMPDVLKTYQSAYAGLVPDSVEWCTDMWELPPADLKAANVYSHTVHLTWNPVQNDLLDGYQVYRDGTEEENLLTEKVLKDASYTDEQLEIGESHTYYVRGCLTDGRKSEFAQITAVTAAPEVRRIYTNDKTGRVGLSRNTVYAEVTNSGNLQSLGAKETTGVFYYKNSTGRKILMGVGEITSTNNSRKTARYSLKWNLDEMESGEYTVVFVLTDGDGESAETEQIITVDKSRPHQIEGVMAVGSTDGINVSWLMSSEINTTKYRVYRKAQGDSDFRIIGYINERETLNYIDESVKAERSYQYYVTGVNDLGVESQPSEIVSASPVSDTEQPRILKMIPASGSRISGNISLGVQAEDNVAVREIQIYASEDGENWTLISSVKKDFASADYDTSKTASGKLWIKGLAVDTSGNESDSFTCQYEIDNVGPSEVGLREEECVTTSVTATLVWDNVPEEDVAFFRVEQLIDGEWNAIGDVNDTLGMNIYGLVPATPYTYRVIAYDQLGNRGAEPEKGITLLTKADDNNPVITELNPKPGTYSQEIPVSATAKDDYGIQKISFQISDDGQAWLTQEVKEFDTPQTTVTAECTLMVKDHEDGMIYFRAVAEDFSGHESETGAKAPFIQYSIDHTPPKAPEISSVEGNNGYIEINWKQGQEEDIDAYQVFRQENDGEYSKIAEGLYQLNYIDRDVKENTQYRYRLKVTDQAGNVSEFSKEMEESVSVLADTEKPEIVSFYPDNSSKIGDDFKNISVLVQDNRLLSSVKLEWKPEKDETYQKLTEKTEINDWNVTVNATLPVEKMNDGDVIEVRAGATDAAGNTCEPTVVKYTVDLTAPKLNKVSSVYQEGEEEKVTLTWNAELPDDLIGFRIYRREDKADWNLIAQRQVVSGQKDYSCDDWNLPLNRTVLEYKVEAVDAIGNTSFRTADEQVILPDRSSPKAVLNCESIMEQNVEYLFDASLSSDDTGIISYEIDFGDNTEKAAGAKAVHKYSEAGTYKVRLTVVDKDGNSSETEKEITVKERDMLGTLKVKVRNADGQALSGAEVYFDLGSENQFVRRTNGSGEAVITANAGTHAVGCIKGNNEYLPVKKEVVITAAQTTEVTMTLVEQPIVEGKFDIRRMNFDEIKAAGIEISDPENQYMVTVNVRLKYGTETVTNKIIFNPVTGWDNAKPVIVDTSSGKRALIPHIVWSGSGAGSGGSGGGSWGGGTGSDDASSVKKLSVIYLDIPIGVSALKEFFDVKLHIMNNASSEFCMLDNEITLNVPKGLAIAGTTSGTENSAHVSVPEIPGQTTKTIEWILRGDELGEYQLSADYSGILSEFNRPVTAHFESEDSIRVYGLQGMKLTAHVANKLKDGSFYYDVDLENKANVERYLPRVNTPGILNSVIYYKNGSKKGVSIAEDSLEVMAVGDKLVYHYEDSVDNYIKEDEELEDRNAKLEEAFYDAQHTYGLEVEIIKEDLDYFEEARDTVTYRFDSRGGSPVASMVDIKKGTRIQLPAIPTKDEQYFNGWFENEDGTGAQLTHRTLASKSMTWYASWSDEPGGAATLLVKLKPDEYGFRIVDNAGNPVEGARVTRKDTTGSETVKTDAEGDAVFKAATVGLVGVTVEKKGYVTFKNLNYDISKAGYDIITLYKTLQEGHMLTKAYCTINGYEALPSAKVDLLKHAKRFSSDAKLDFTITCETASGNLDGERLELWQNTTKIAEADQKGVFKLSPGKFGTGKGIHVRNYYDANDKTKYVRTLLNLEIVEAPSTNNTLSLGRKSAVTVDDDVPFLGGMNLSLGLPTLPVDFEVDAEKQTMHLGINVKKGVFSAEKEREAFKKWISSMKENYEFGSRDVADLNAKYDQYCKQKNRMSVGGWDIKKPELTAIGYFEGKLSSGNVTQLKGYLCVMVKASAQYGWTIPTAFSIPMVIEIKFSGSGELSATATYNIETSNLSGTLAFDFKPSVDALFGVGFSGITAAGVTGNASLDLQFYLASTNGDPGLNAATLSGSLGVKAYFGSAETSKIFKQKTWYLYTRNNQQKSAAECLMYADVLYDEDSYSETDRSYLKKQSQWKGSEESSDEIKSLLTDTYGGMAPQIASAGDTSVMVFRYDDGTTDVYNMGRLMYSVWKDGKWQEPRPVDDNDLADIDFNLYSDGNEIYLTYQEATEQLTKETAALKELTKHTGLRTAKYDAETEKFTSAEEVTEKNSDVYAFRPKTGIAGGQEVIAWVGNTDSSIFGRNKNNKLLCRVKNGNRWSEVKTLLDNSNYISTISIGTLGDQAVILCCVDGDNDPATVSDGTVYGLDLKGNILFNEAGGCSHAVYVNEEVSGGLKGFVWNQSGTLKLRDSVENESISLTGEETITNSTFKACGNRIYYLGADENNAQNIFCITKQNGGWSSPVQVTAQTEQITSFDVCRIGGEDYITMMQSNMDFENPSDNLCWMKVGTVHDLSLDGTTFELKDAMPGTTLPVTLKIRNAGSESVSRIGYKVTMQSADQTEKVLVEEEKDVTITAGETVPVVVNVPIPENISSRKLKLQIWEMKDGAVVDEVSDNNNFSEITVGLTDLEVSAKLYTTAAKNSLVVTVKNNSQVPAAGSLKIYDAACADGVLLQEHKTEILEAGQEQSIRLELSNDIFKEGTTELELTAEVESETADYDSSNNHDEVIVDKKVKVSFYSEGELLEENIYQAGEVLELPQTPQGNGEFAGWFCDGKEAEEGQILKDDMEFYAVFRQNIKDAEISEISAKCYTGAEIRPEFTVIYQGAALSQSTDYTVTWRNNVKVGTATAVLTGIGDYFGMKEITFVIENHKWDGPMKTVQEATALAYGSQERTCTRCGKKETNQLAKLRPTMSVNASSIVLRRGQSTTKLKVTGLAKGDRIASWTSSNKKIVNVNSSGKIKAAKKNGKATITITLRSGYKKKISVKVQKTAVKTTKIQGIQKKLTIRRKKSCTLMPEILPITSLEKVTFTSSNKKVATVTAKGKVTAKKKGTAVITVKAGRIRKRCKITVR